MASRGGTSWQTKPLPKSSQNLVTHVVTCPVNVHVVSTAVVLPRSQFAKHDVPAVLHPL